MKWVKIKSRSGEDYAEYQMRGAGHRRGACVIVIGDHYSTGISWDKANDTGGVSQYCHGTKDGDRERAMQWCEWWLGFRDAPPSDDEEAP
jgi:hypothetical protein